MNRVISVDLACRAYADIGIVSLSIERGTIEGTYVPASELGLSGIPDGVELADRLVDLCHAHQAAVLLLDGPQAWKHPDNGLPHCRVCEKHFNTPAKTGLPGMVKPAAYTRFLRFSIGVFAALRSRGARMLHTQDDIRRRDGLLALESFPYATWGRLGLPALPAKRRSPPAVVSRRCLELCDKFGITVNAEPTHDELQALVAGLAGAAIVRGEWNRVEVGGTDLSELQGTLREGYIVVPKA